jgi:hypothetical protein
MKPRRANSHAAEFILILPAVMLVALSALAFGGALKKKMDALGMESHLNYPGSTESQYAGLTRFLIVKLQTATTADSKAK